MAKKAELLEQASALGLTVTAKNTIAEIEAAINGSATPDNMAENEKVDAAETTETFAKSGRRSRKAVAEAEAIIEKKVRKEEGDTTPQSDEAEARTKRGPKPITRPRIERRGKKYRAVAVALEKGKVYSLAEALTLATKTNPASFDASVEIHVKLGVDPRQADQNIRATVSLPHGTGKVIRVAVFAPEADHVKAKEAGADIVGDETFLKQLDNEEMNFDVLIAPPQYMARLGKYARMLGPRGLMPNPKSGTVAADVVKAVREAKAGKVEYRVDKQAIVHLAIGKVSFGEEKLHENAKTFFDSLSAQRPSSLKGSYVRSTSITTTMGPGIKVENVVN